MKAFFRHTPEKTSPRHRAEELVAAMPELFSHMPHPARDNMRGSHALRRTGSGENFWQFREYAGGDALNTIDWRRSGKSDAIYTRQKEHQSRQTILFWTAAGPDMDFASDSAPTSKAEAAQTLTLALALLVNHNHEKISWLNANDLSAGGAITRLENNLLNPRQESLPVRIEKIIPRATLLLVGDFISPMADIKISLEPLMAACRKTILIQILDPLETDLECDGRIIFESPADAERETIEHAASIKGQYKARIEKHREDLKKFCHANGGTYIFHRTDQDLHKTLLQAWQAFNEAPC